MELCNSQKIRKEESVKEVRTVTIKIQRGETKTIEQAIENPEQALKHYFGDNVKIGKHSPFGLNYFADENMWLIYTQYDPDRLGGGISFTIDGETGELSEYEMNE